MAVQTNQPTGWVGWGYFASFMLMLVGILEAMAGLAAIFRQGFYVVSESSLLVFNFKTWGWISLILGIVVFMAGLELLRDAMWARVVAVVLALLSFVANMGFFNAYPWWSTIMMVVNVLVIYAVTVHGAELKQ